MPISIGQSEVEVSVSDIAVHDCRTIISQFRSQLRVFESHPAWFPIHHVGHNSEHDMERHAFSTGQVDRSTGRRPVVHGTLLIRSKHNWFKTRLFPTLQPSEHKKDVKERTAPLSLQRRSDGLWDSLGGFRQDKRHVKRQTFLPFPAGLGHRNIVFPCLKTAIQPDLPQMVKR